MKPSWPDAVAEREETPLGEVQLRMVYDDPGHGVMSVCRCEAGRFTPMAYPRLAK